MTIKNVGTILDRSNGFLDRSNGFFTSMVDHLVVNESGDKDWSEALKWLDNQAQKKGISFYDQVFEMLYRNDKNQSATEWFKTKN